MSLSRKTQKTNPLLFSWRNSKNSVKASPLVGNKNEKLTITVRGGLKRRKLFLMKKLMKLPVVDRPREKLKQKGAQALSDIELLSALIGSGIKGHDVLSLSKQLLSLVDTRNGNLQFDELAAVQGIGDAKASQLIAALEFAKRRIHPPHHRITFPADVLPMLSAYRDKKQEHFISISLDGAQSVINVRVVSIGLVDRTQVHPREVFADPITDRASAIIVAHNHPNGEPGPSKNDEHLTHRLSEAGNLLGIKLFDHIIVSRSGYYSFLENGLV